MASDPADPAQSAPQTAPNRPAPPGAAPEDPADVAIALRRAAPRRIPEGLAEMQAGRWEGWAPTAHLG
ncbi:hypothetical protein IC63_13090, partial [Paracoccus sphaerophysae]